MNESRDLYLVMTFETSDGGTTTVTVKQIRDDLEKEDIKEVMDGIVATNVFDSKTGDLVKVVKADIIDKVTEDYDLRPQA